MKKILNVYTDASADSGNDSVPGSIAFSVWGPDNICLGRISSIVCDYHDAGILELIAIRTSLEWVCDNFQDCRAKVITDSDTALMYIKHTSLSKEPFRFIADDINSMDMIEHIGCIKSHTSHKGIHYMRNADVDMLAKEARQKFCTERLVSHSTEVSLTYRPELGDDTDILKPIDARKLVKNYYVEKEVKLAIPHIQKKQIISEVKSGMSPSEKFAARFWKFKK